MEIGLLAVFVLGLFCALVAQLLWRASHPEDETLEALRELPVNDAGLPAPTRPRPPDHVHTYARNSVEQTNGLEVAIYRCAECGDVERWVLE